MLFPDAPRSLDDGRGTEAEADLVDEAGVVLEGVLRPGHPRQHVAQNPLLTAAIHFQVEADGCIFQQIGCHLVLQTPQNVWSHLFAHGVHGSFHISSQKRKMSISS